MTKTSTGVNWNSAKEEFATAGVSERGFEFLKALCDGTNVDGVEKDVETIAHSVIAMSKGLTQTSANEYSGAQGFNWREASTDEQQGFITADLATLEKMAKDPDLSSAVRVLSTALGDPSHQLFKMAQNMTSEVKPEVRQIDMPDPRDTW
jgi:hypothetical protein